MTGLWKINGVDLFGTYGVVITKGNSYSELLKLPKMKAYLSYNWREEDLNDIDFSLPRYEEREMVIDFALIAKTVEEWDAKYDAFKDQMTRGGVIQLFIYSLNKTFNLYYKDSASMGILSRTRSGKIAATFSLRFGDTNERTADQYANITASLTWENTPNPLMNPTAGISGSYYVGRGYPKGSLASAILNFNPVSKFYTDTYLTGWYNQSNILVSNDTRYDFEVKEDTQLTARLRSQEFEPIPTGNIFPNTLLDPAGFSQVVNANFGNNQIEFYGRTTSIAVAPLSPAVMQDIYNSGRKVTLKVFARADKVCRLIVYINDPDNTTLEGQFSQAGIEYRGNGQLIQLSIQLSLKPNLTPKNAEIWLVKDASYFFADTLILYRPVLTIG